MNTKNHKRTNNKKLIKFKILILDNNLQLHICRHKTVLYKNELKYDVLALAKVPGQGQNM